MDVDADDPSLRQLFSTDTPDILAELESIQRLHSISAQELFYKWESFCMKMGAEETKLTLDNVRALKRDIQEALDRESKARHHLRAEKGHGHSSAARNRIGAGVDVFGMLDDIVPTTPSSAKLQQQQSLSKRKSPFQTPSRTGKSPKFPTQPSRLQESSPLGPVSSPATQSTPFNKRRSPGEVLEILNVQLPRADSPMVPFSEPRIRPTANTDLKKFGYRPMAMRLSANSEVLDDKIDEFLEDIHKAAAAGTIKVDPSEIGNAAQCSPREIVAVGMIACDSPEGKLNPASLMLEMSRRTGAGLRVPLKVLDLTRIQFFPGQIVALRGNNPTGEYFNVASVINPPLLPPAASPPQTFQEINERVNGADGANEGIPLNYLIASGPYTADDNLNFEPLHAICEKAAEQKVDSLILLGPFLDLEHPLIAAGDIELPPIKGVDPDKVNMHTLFKYMIAAPIVKLTQEYEM
ncbi:DNA-directed DNA polymerase alpha subunit pol12 [Ascosphaera atra]|nr:DNA-directed DNA polymerase alpha subunit pol12 [Ascosphaera atra]